MSPGPARVSGSGLAALGVEPPPAGSQRVWKDEPGTLIWVEPLPEGGRAVYKMYRRRSPWVHWRERLTRFRVEREYEVLRHLADHGVGCTEPILWTRGASRQHGRYEILATREIGDAVSLRQLLGEHSAGDAFDLGGLYRTVRRMHEAGVYHAVLKPDNVLVARGPAGDPSFFVVDTPRALLFPRSIVGTPMARRDLQHLTHGLTQLLGLPWSKIALEAYGLDEAQRREFIERFVEFRKTKSMRWRLRWEFIARWLWARITHRARAGR